MNGGVVLGRAAPGRRNRELATPLAADRPHELVRRRQPDERLRAEPAQEREEYAREQAKI